MDTAKNLILQVFASLPYQKRREVLDTILASLPYQKRREVLDSLHDAHVVACDREADEERNRFIKQNRRSGKERRAICTMCGELNCSDLGIGRRMRNTDRRKKAVTK